MVKSIAYCSPLGSLIRVASEKNFVAPGSAGVAIATCPRNSEVVAGGFANPGFNANGSRVLTLTSKRAGMRRWRLEGFTFGNDGDQDAGRDLPPCQARQRLADRSARHLRAPLQGHRLRLLCLGEELVLAAG